LTVVCAVVYIVFFSVGPGAIPWLITSELFESDARGKATSIAVFCNWLANFIVVVSFPFVKDLVGDYTFFIFGVLLILFALFTLFFCPETKNKRTEDIVDNFDKRFIFFPS
jgi:SP family facilitated glucose transporter-like MFS transporter 1